MGPALHLIARLYAVEERAKALVLTAEQRLERRQRVAAPVMEKLHAYLLELKPQVLPKSPSGAAVRYALNQWTASWKSTTERPIGLSGISPWAGGTGLSSAATRAGGRQRFCGPSSLRASGTESNRSPGSGTCCRGSQSIRSTGSPNSCLTTGNR